MSKKLARVVVCLLVLLWMGASWWARKEFLPYDVRNTDIGTYLFQTQTFADGHLFRPTPEPREFFRQWQVVVGDQSYAYYPPGHALLLALGIKMGWEPWIIPWILSGLCIVICYLWIRRLTHSYVAALFGVCVLAASPFFAANMTSVVGHSSTLFVTFVFLLSIWDWAQNKRTVSAWIAGFSLGWIFATREPNAAALGLSWVVWIFWVHRHSLRDPHPVFHRRVVQPWLFFFGGLGTVLAPLMLYYHHLSGKWQLHLFTNYWPRNRYGFGKDLGRGEVGHYFQTYQNHDLTSFFGNWKYYLVALAEWWTGSAWLSAFLLVLAIFFLIYRVKQRREHEPIFQSYGSPLLSSTTVLPPQYAKMALGPLIAWPLLHIFLYSLYFTDSTRNTGPRYLVEIMPVLALTTGWTLSKIQPHLIGRWLSLGLLLGILVVGTQFKYRFYTSDPNKNLITNVQQLEKCVNEAKRPAVVLIRSFWIGHPFPNFLNRTELKDDIIFACDRGAEDRKLIEKFPDRNAYILAVDILAGKVPEMKLIPIYESSTHRWVAQPEEISSSFWIGSNFTKPIQLKGDTARTLFYPKPDEIPNQVIVPPPNRHN